VRLVRLMRRLVPVLGVLLWLAACMSDQGLPLPRQPALAPSVASLRHQGVALGGRLSVADIARLTVQNDPDLLAMQAQHGVAQAQLLQAGLLPNPQISGAFLPLLAGFGTTNAFNAGFTEDIRALITLRSRRRTAAAAASQVDAQLLWQAWQAVGQARLLAVDIIKGDQSLRLLLAAEAMLADRSRRSQAAAAAGNATLVTLAPDLAALQSARATALSQQGLQLQRRHALNALLGLAPDAPLPLAGAPDLPPFDPASVLAALPTLPERRPDLVALQMGYRAQEQKVRTAVLSQFPNFLLGVSGGSDNVNTRVVGPQAALELPLFDRNQGNIAIERATRQQLHDEYAARLSAADGQVRAMVSEMALQARQLAAVRADLTGVKSAAARATAALASGNIDERSYVDLVSARIAKEQEIVTIELAQLERRVAIATLVGAGMPPIALPPQ